MGVPFGPRGTRLWAFYCERVAGEAPLALLEELCRTADRLDRLDALLVGDADSWARLVPRRDDETTFELVIDGALSEARQQGQAFARLFAALPVKDGDDDSDPDAWLADLSAPVRDP